MKLLNADLATVPEAKILGYLLNPAHPAGGSKAAFFLRHGFTRQEWAKLAEALRRHAVENEVTDTETTRRHAVRRGWAARCAGWQRLERPERVVYRSGQRGAAFRHRASVAENMNTINELDPVVLTVDLPESGLEAGDVGTAVMVHGEGAAFEVEFAGYDGRTVALLTLDCDKVRPMRPTDLPHARTLEEVG